MVMVERGRGDDNDGDGVEIGVERGRCGEGGGDGGER